MIYDDLELQYHLIALLFDKVGREKISQVSLHDSDVWSKDLFHHSEILLSSNLLSVAWRPESMVFKF